MDTDKNATPEPIADPAPQPDPAPDSPPGSSSSPPRDDPPQRAGQRMFAAVREWGITREAGAPIGGVAGGLAKRLRTSSTFMRVIVVALVLLTGVGALAYAAAWALLPEEGTGRIHLEDAIAGTWSPAWIGIVVLAMLSMSDDEGSGALWLLVIGAVAMLLLRSAPPGSLDSSAVPLDKVPSTAPQRSTPWVALVALAVLMGLTISVMIPAVDLGYLSTRGAFATTALVAVVLGAAFLLVAALRRRSVSALAAFTLTAVLAVLVAALTPALPSTHAADRELVGEMSRTPSTLAQAQDGFALGIGSMTLDLRDLPSGSATVDASVGIGDLTVIVPEGRHYAVDVTGINAMSMPSERHDVSPQRDERRPHERDAGQLRLNLQVGAGEVTVLEK